MAAITGLNSPGNGRHKQASGINKCVGRIGFGTYNSEGIYSEIWARFSSVGKASARSPPAIRSIRSFAGRSPKRWVDRSIARATDRSRPRTTILARFGVRLLKIMVFARLSNSPACRRRFGWLAGGFADTRFTCDLDHR